MPTPTTLSRRVTAVLGAVAFGLLVTPGPAVAGGPTSVLLSSPQRQHTASLYHSDVDYQRLQQALGQAPAGSQADAPNVTGGPGSGAVNVTWLIHDVQVWRVDRILLRTEGEPWIETTLSTDPAARAAPVLHRPTDAKTVLALLDKYGLVGTRSAAQVEAAEPQSAESPVAPLAEPADDAAGSAWWWLLIGAAAGATVTAAVRPLLARRQRAAPASS